MKPYLLYIIGTIFFVLIQIAASAQCRLSGYVRDTAGAGIPYCTVSIQNENRTVIAGTVSDSTGQYKLAIQPGKNYFVACSHLAFQSASVPVTASRDTTLNFALVTATNRIDPVVVTAKFIDYKAGKYTVGIAGNPIAENRSTQELLGLLPGVTSHDSEYKINGQPVSIIYIGDREIKNRKELEALRAEDIERIEIQNKAGSAYDATLTGGIIRITLKKLSSGSYYGNVDANYTLSRGKKGYMISVPFSGQYKKLNIVNYLEGYYANQTPETERSEFFRDQNYVISAIEKGKSHDKSFYDNLGLVYELNNRHSIGISGTFIWVSSDPTTTESSIYQVYDPLKPATLPAAKTLYERKGNYEAIQYQACLNYNFETDSLGSGLEVKADFIHAIEERKYDFNTETYPTGQTSLPASSSLYREHNKPETSNFESRIAYLKMFTPDRSLTVGGRYNLYEIKTRLDYSNYENGQWEKDEEKSLDVRNRVTGAAAFAEYADAYGKFSYLVGLDLQWDRIGYMENASTNWSNTDYLRLFPTVSLSYDWKESRLNLDVSYYSGTLPTTQLVPRPIRENQNTYSIGNPYLQPSTGYDIGLSLILKNKWSFSYYYGKDIKLTSTQSFYSSDNPNIIYRMPVNDGKSTGQAMNIGYSSALAKWVRLSMNLHGQWSKYTFPEYEYVDRSGTFNLTTYFNILPTVGGSLYFSVDSPFKRPSMEVGWGNSLGCTLFANLLKRKIHLELGLYGIIYKDRITRYYIPDGSYSSNVHNKFQRQWCNFKFSYRFNHKATRQVRQVETLQDVNKTYQ